MPEIKFEGITELDKKLMRNLNLDAVKQVVQKNGDQMNERMKAKTQIAFRKGYTMGDTAGSINTEITDGGMTAEVGPTTDYHAYVELGTRKMTAEPFIKPAWEEQKMQFKSDMDRLVR